MPLLTFLFLYLSFFSLILHGNVENPSPHFTILKKHIEKLMRDLDVPGVAVSLVYEGKSYLYQFGYADKASEKLVTENTIFELASITKVFTSTALAIEVLRGKMALHDPVAKYIPQLLQTTNPISQVKLIDLATHTSSLPRVPPPKENLIAFLLGWKPSYPIATKYVYSNFGFALLGFAVANVENEDYEPMIRKLITGPLQMTSTYVQVPPALMANYAQGYTKNGKLVKNYTSALWPGGGALRSTGKDMLKFLEANLSLTGPVDLIKAMQFAQQGYFKVRDNFILGLGWQLYFPKENLKIIDKNRGLEGFSTYIGMIPEQKLGIVILMNKAKAHPTQVGREILLDLSHI